jgi:hypothetical protein
MRWFVVADGTYPGSMPLFDDKVRTDSRLGRRTESIFGFLDRVNRPEFAVVRDLMNGWFERFPAEAHADLRARFRSDDPGQSLGAFWELYLHGLFRARGYTLKRDPEVPGTSRRPDFLVIGEGGEFYLEATTVGYSKDEMAARRRRNVVLDLVDEAQNPDFWVTIQVPGEGRKTPSRRDIVPKLEAQLNSLDWATVVNSDGAQPEFDLHARDWVLHFRVHARDEALRGDPLFPMIGMGPSWAGYVDERQYIESDLRAKSTRYGRPDKPFVIGALCLRDFATDESIEQALYGPQVIRVPVVDGTGSIGDAEAARDPHAFWQWGQEQRATRVSAVLTARHINPWVLLEPHLTLWKNPWASLPLEVELPFRTATGNLKQNRLEFADATAEARDILGLHDGWPAPPSE